jgi:hypothetical protein
MAAGCAVGWWVMRVVAPEYEREVTAGIVGPLAAAAVTWLLAARAHRANPASVTGVLLMAFFTKMILFGAYVVVAMKTLQLRAVPFAIAFTCCFLVLHMTDALLLRRLGRGDTSVGRS